MNNFYISLLILVVAGERSVAYAKKRDCGTSNLFLAISISELFSIFAVFFADQKLAQATLSFMGLLVFGAGLYLAFVQKDKNCMIKVKEVKPDE